MAQVVPYKAEHMLRLNLQRAQAYMEPLMTEEYAKNLENDEVHCFTLLHDGDVLACGGVVPLWQGRAAAWMMISHKAEGRAFLLVHKAVSRFLSSCYINRIEASVDCDFPAGHKWMKLLGFKMEAERMRGYRPDGGDCALYARVLS